MKKFKYKLNGYHLDNNKVFTKFHNKSLFYYLVIKIKYRYETNIFLDKINSIIVSNKCLIKLNYGDILND